MSNSEHRIRSFDFKFEDETSIPFEIGDYSNFSQTTLQVALSKYPHRHTFYEVLYYTGGKGTHYIDFKPYTLTTPVFYFITPGQVHYWNIQEPLSGKYLLFTQDFLLTNPLAPTLIEEMPFFHNVMLSPELVISNDQKKQNDHQMDMIESEYGSDQKGMTSVLRSALQILLIYLTRYYSDKESEIVETRAYLQLARKFKQLISRHLDITLSMAFFAKQLGISQAHMADMIKTITGLSPGKLFRQEIALEAKRLLVHSDLSAAQIGYQLEFSDPSYFGRFFKRETGQSPREFRTQIREEYQSIQ